MNLKLFQSIKTDFIAVTKYLSPQEMAEIFPDLHTNSRCVGVGENRIKFVMEKNIPRNFCHFIGHLQSRDISNIVHNCSFIHSVCEIHHYEKICQIAEKSQQKIRIFFQINISHEPQKNGILPSDVPEFLVSVAPSDWVEVVGISALGAADISKNEKQKEFQELKNIRDKFFRRKIISAGTSADWHIAQKEGIELLRIGRVLWDDEF